MINAYLIQRHSDWHENNDLNEEAKEERNKAAKEQQGHTGLSALEQ